VKPNVIGEQVMEVDLDILVPYIDWTPFLELAIVRKYPAILTDEVVGEQAKFQMQEMLLLF
jgi:5-methyltetrahydrofolate--homocysteine methyltransferase